MNGRVDLLKQGLIVAFKMNECVERQLGGFGCLLRPQYDLIGRRLRKRRVSSVRATCRQWSDRPSPADNQDEDGQSGYFSVWSFHGTKFAAARIITAAPSVGHPA